MRQAPEKNGLLVQNAAVPAVGPAQRPEFFSYPAPTPSSTRTIQLACPRFIV
jgi:hypothetical protein